MNEKPDQKLSNRPSTGEQPTGPIFRLIPGGEPKQAPERTVNAGRQNPSKQASRPGWNDNDDDPGPSAA